ncbi:uncharacterized protein LOC128851137 isoform X2 [Cuculus canorus]|uniref:uncharacterized protein LOC128851137 isoform X2 n=1 Tax=Cuculus canorus TaxID=55661 RepID=UPI0023AAD9AC|nr:uncharacterized protein LOC128851137 isoform X2 [Cuculus canorus]
MEEAAVAELAELLAVPAAREAAAEVALALSGSAEGRKLLLEGPPGVLEALLELGTTPWPPAACCAAGGHVNPSAGRQGRGGQVNPSTGGQGVLGGQVNPSTGGQGMLGGQVNPSTGGQGVVGGQVNPSTGGQGMLGGQVNPSTGGQGVLGGQGVVGGQVNPSTGGQGMLGGQVNPSTGGQGLGGQVNPSTGSQGAGGQIKPIAGGSGCQVNPNTGGKGAGGQVNPSTGSHGAGRQVNPSTCSHGAGCQVNPSTCSHGAGCQVNPSTCSHGAGCQVNPSTCSHGAGCQVNPCTCSHGAGCQVNPTVGGQVNPALSCLVNLSSEPAARERLLAALPALLRLLPAGPACGVLANLCRDREAAQRVLQGLEENGSGLESLLGALREPRPPPELGSLLCNLSQIPEGRRGILDRSRRSVQRLLPHTQFPAVLELRRGLIGALRNCCFQYEAHEWLLSEEVDVLPFLLLPLAGPEEFPEDEMEQLPVDLQYLPPEKQREEEPDIRKMLLETIMLLSATAVGRGVLRAKGTFPVLRELHRSEQEPRVLAACQKLIQVLIGDDPPPGMENLLTVEVPAEVELQLQRLDREEEEEEERRWEEAQRGDGAHGEDLGPPRGGMSSTSPQRLNISSDGDSTTSSTS